MRARNGHNGERDNVIWIAKGGAVRTAARGYAAGYESEAAFSRAVKREFGKGMGVWRRQLE